MLFWDLVTLTLFAVLQVAVSQSITRLYIPGFDSQSIVGNIVGVAGGSTTWSLQDQDSKTAILVAGADFATAVFSAPEGSVISKACSLTVGLALCATSTALEAAIAVETPIFVPVQIAAVQPTSSPVLLSSQAVEQPTTTRGPSQTLDNPAAQNTSSGESRTFFLRSVLPMWSSVALVLVLL